VKDSFPNFSAQHNRRGWLWLGVFRHTEERETGDERRTA
jgi:hypothetical protein